EQARHAGGELPRIALGSLRSHSGFKAPLLLLWKEYGLLPGRDYEFTVAGTQTDAIKGICASPPQFPIAPVAGDYLARRGAQGAASAARSRSVYPSPPYPPACIGCVHNLKAELREAILKIFLELKIPGSSLEKEFKGQGQVRFARVDYKKDWAAVREV